MRRLGADANRKQVDALLDRFRSGDAERSVTPGMAREFKHALGVNKSVRVRQAKVVSLSTTESAAMVEFPESTETSQVPYFDCLPVPDKGCWVVTDGEDAFITSTGKNSGPPSIRVGLASDQNILADNDTNLFFNRPMSGAGVPQNNGWDWFGHGYNIVQNFTDRKIGWGGFITESDTFNARVYFPAPGVWRVDARTSWEGENAGRRELLVKDADDGNVAGDDRGASFGTLLRMSCNGEVHLTSVDAAPFVRAQVFQNTTLTLAVNSGTGTSLSITWLGPSGVES